MEKAMNYDSLQETPENRGDRYWAGYFFHRRYSARSPLWQSVAKRDEDIKKFCDGFGQYVCVCVCIYFCDYSVSFEDVSQAVYYIFFFAGGCRCHPGYYGDYCSALCPEGRYGCGCRSTCRCPGNQTTCNPVTGQCHCPPGFIGLSCESSESPLCSPLMTSPFTRNVCARVCMCARVSVRVWELWVYHAASLVNLLFGISGE